MKTNTTLIEAQQICLAATQEVFNHLQNTIARLEKEGAFREEPSLQMEPYNNGYQILNDISMDWRNNQFEHLPTIFGGIHIQPSTFFAADMVEGRAYIEYSHFLPDVKGYRNDRIEVGNIDQTQVAARIWINLIVSEIDKF